jgi:hypothetical protein
MLLGPPDNGDAIWWTRSGLADGRWDRAEQEVEVEDSPAATPKTARAGRRRFWANMVAVE